VLGLASGQLAVGSPADICVFDPEATWQLTPEALKSRGKNSPWMGYMMTGKVSHTLVGGRLVYQA
jgi:dihydroorotase